MSKFVYISRQSKKKISGVAIIGSFVVAILLGWFSYDYVNAQQEEKNIRQNFSSQVSTYLQKIKQFSVLDVTDIGKDYTSISLDVQKNPSQYISGLKQQFRKKVLAYSGNVSLEIEKDIMDRVHALSLEQQIAQRFIIGIPGTGLDKKTKGFLKSSQPGGVIYMKRNISSSLSGLSEHIQATNTSLPLFISIDQEGGPVKRITEDLPGQSDITLKNVCKVYQERRDLLVKHGINLNFSLVVDTTTDKKSFIFSRIFQVDLAKLFPEIMRCSQGLLMTAKHRPGHGAVKGDTHKGLLTLGTSTGDRKKIHREPFIIALNHGVDAVMMGHLIAPWIDQSYPASLSPKHEDYMRNLGYTGLLITDDMQMIDSNYTRKESLLLALKSNIDILLYVDPTMQKKILDQAITYYKQGKVDQKSLEKSVARIITKKLPLRTGVITISRELVE